jgi:hypothetical protein
MVNTIDMSCVCGSGEVTTVTRFFSAACAPVARPATVAAARRIFFGGDCISAEHIHILECQCDQVTDKKYQEIYSVSDFNQIGET